MKSGLEAQRQTGGRYCLMARFRLFPFDDVAFMATTMRMGWEWLPTPLLVYRNDHLIHHLSPTVPFYKMHDVC